MDSAALNQLRSIEELSNHQKGVKEKIEELETEYRGLPFPENAREEYASLVDENEEITARVQELDKRQKYLAAMSNDNRTTEKAQPIREEKVSLSERDVFDTSQLRIDPDNPARGRQQYRDRAMKAVELAHFPEYGITKERAQDHVARLLDENDTEDGQLARRILKTGAPQYRAAFRKWMSGTPMTNEEQRAFALNTTGIPITFTLDPTIIPVSSSVVNPLRAISNVESTRWLQRVAWRDGSGDHGLPSLRSRGHDGQHAHAGPAGDRLLESAGVRAVLGRS